MAEFPEVVVVGSANIDLVASVSALPRPGETVLASGYAEHSGGKGANQAIAAARLGRQVAIIGRVGEDAAGDLVRGALAQEGVDVGRLLPTPRASTGRALISVDTNAENCIVVVPGANAALTAQDVSTQGEVLAGAGVVVAQLEVPLEAVRQAASLARGRFILNPAPATALDAALLELVDVLVVNEGEFRVVTGHAVPELPEALAPVLTELALPCAVVVTLGARGAAVWQDGELTLLPAPAVEVVDTTGAGDTFVGALADALVRGSSLPEAAHWAVSAASISTSLLGATSAMPRPAQVEELLVQQGVGPS